ncbi:polysaccharide deacetylase family protein [Thalassolituus sp. LLYu03]|uniref:polysaccharide deacetylase family protein n=1 Tax=Thalassolituus sp. LLYu03 TaxID=3421656 RepID=UPI003D285464
MYHQVGDFKNIRTLKANYCHYKRFARQMAMLRLTRQCVIPMSEASRFLAGEGDYPDRCVAITFDDGYENFYHFAFPVLKKYNLPAMVYVVTGQLSGRSEWLKEDGHEPKALMSAEQIRDIYTNGIEIGSHSVTHPRLAGLDADECFNELRQSKHDLEELLAGAVIDHVCYPYGSFNDEVSRLAGKAGYRVGTTTVKGLALPDQNLLALSRKAVSFNDGMLKTWKNIHRL